MTPWRICAAAGALALAIGACGDGRAGPIEPQPPRTGDLIVTGTVFTIDGTVPAGLRVIIDGGSRTTAPIGADGHFSVQGRVTGDSASVIIDAAEGTTRSLLPALVRVSSRLPATGLRFVLVPRQWTVTGGAYQGTTFDVSLDAAFRAPCTDLSDLNCDGFFPRAWLTGVKAWADHALPVPLAFDHARSHQTISAADSAQLWTVVERMNADAGTALFRPARADELAISGAGMPNGGVVIRVDTTLDAKYGAWANWWWNANGEMYAAVVRPRSLSHLRSGPLMTHELLHTHGFKHACAWSSVMGGWSCGSTQRLSAADVAYAQLARSMYNAQRRHAAPHGLAAALQGERVVLRNLPLFAVPAAHRLQALRADSIGDGDHAH
jgi:hypothetical protein